MSIKSHPNIQAIALTADVYKSIHDNLRGPAGEDMYTRNAAMDIVIDELGDFVVAISLLLDRKFGIGDKK